MTDLSALVDAAEAALGAAEATRAAALRTEAHDDLEHANTAYKLYLAAVSVAVDALIADGRPASLEERLRALPVAEKLIIARTADPQTIDEFMRISGDDHPVAPYILNWAEFWTAEDDDTGDEWVVPLMFARGRGHAVFAGAKTGKSYATLAACAAAATGREWMGVRCEPIRILYLDYEMTEQDVRDRLTEFGYGPDDDLSNLHYALLPSLPPLDTPAGGDDLLASAIALQVDLTVVDTTARAVNGDENDADTYRAYYRCTGQKLKQAGITAVRIDHAGKDVSKGQRGSSAKNDDVDVVWQVTRTDSGQRWTATHRRMSWVPDKVDITVTEDDDGITRFTTPDAAMPSWPAGTTECAADLEALGVAVGASTRTAAQALRDAGLGRRNNVIRAGLKWRMKQVHDADAEWSPTHSASTEARPKKPGRVQNQTTGARPAGAVGRDTENPIITDGARIGARSGALPSTPRPDVCAPLRGTPGAVAAETPDDTLWLDPFDMPEEANE